MSLDEAQELCFSYLCENIQNRKEREGVDDFYTQKEIEILDHPESSENYSGYYEASLHISVGDVIEQFDKVDMKSSVSELEGYPVKKLMQDIDREEKYFQKIIQERRETAKPKIVEILDSGSSVVEDSE